ncbi:MAG: UbiD family decarboxylase, partial [Romboutsia sp.]
MNFKELFDKGVDFIDNNRKSIITVSLSILGLILLIVVFFISSDELSMGKQSDALLKSIENRKYNNASQYYNNTLKKEFSEKKMRRFNKSISKKIDKLLLINGDKYVSGQITKEEFLALINTINLLDEIELNIERIIEQARRVSQMYQSESIEYDTAISYISIVANLNVIVNEVDIYKQTIKEFYESRQLYKTAREEQEKQKYFEAIKEFDKVLEEDKKYYDLAQKNKKQCIENMYDYYLEKAEESNTQGNYEEALQYIEYIKKYYIDDEDVLSLEKKYQKNLSLYTLTSEDIINIITKKSDIKKKNLSINSYQQMIDQSKYYYVEVFEHEMLIDEILIDAKTKLVYSYKDADKQYKTNYSDGYFRIIEDGKIQFAINEDKAQFILKNKLEEKGNKYRDLYSTSKEKSKKYINSNVDIDKFLGKEEKLYYYEIVNKGLFNKKQVYIINMYNEKVYFVSTDS